MGPVGRTSRWSPYAITGSKAIVYYFSAVPLVTRAPPPAAASRSAPGPGVRGAADAILHGTLPPLERITENQIASALRPEPDPGARGVPRLEPKG